MRTTVLRLAAALAVVVSVAGGCSSNKGASPGTTAAFEAAGTTTVGASAAASAGPTAASGSTTSAGAPPASVAAETTTSFDAEATGDAIALGEALGYDITNDDAACIKATVGADVVALLDENDIGALPAKNQGDLFQSLAKCAAATIVQDKVTALPGLLGVSEDQATCVGQAYVSTYSENRKAAEEGARTFDELDPDVQSYIRDKLGACLPPDQVDEYLSEQAG